PGARLTVRTTAATLAHPCPDGGWTEMTVTAALAPGAVLAWLPEPLVACGGCCHRSRSTVDLGEGAAAVWYEACTLGRSGERAGPLPVPVDRSPDRRGGPCPWLSSPMSPLSTTVTARRLAAPSNARR